MQPKCGRGIGGLIAVLMIALGTVGCHRPTQAVVPPPRWEGVTLRVAAAEGRPRRLVDQLGRAWANSVGAKISVVVPTGDWPAADLVLIPAPDLPKWAAAGKATPLPTPDAVDAFMPIYRIRLLSWAGTPYCAAGPGRRSGVCLPSGPLRRRCRPTGIRREISPAAEAARDVGRIRRSSRILRHPPCPTKPTAFACRRRRSLRGLRRRGGFVRSPGRGHIDREIGSEPIGSAVFVPVRC